MTVIINEAPSILARDYGLRSSCLASGNISVKYTVAHLNFLWDLNWYAHW